jgi:hypothetical protein
MLGTVEQELVIVFGGKSYGIAQHMLVMNTCVFFAYLFSSQHRLPMTTMG